MKQEKEIKKIKENQTALIKLDGTVEDVVFKNESNGYIVLVLDVSTELVGVTGNLGDIAIGEKLSLMGNWFTSEKYGKQFKAVACERTPPETTDEIRKYLGSGLIRGLGPSLAKKITDVFGEKTLEIIENAPQRLAEVSGITSDRAIYIGAEYRRVCGVKNVIEFLGKFGVGPQTAVNIWHKYNSSSIPAVQENPYILCNDGIDLSFEFADKMAQEFEVNFNPSGRNRARAAIAHVLKQNANLGHTCLPWERLKDHVCEFYGISADAFEIALDDGLDGNEFAILTSGEKSRVYLWVYFQAEQYISEKLARMLILSRNTQKDFSREIAEIEFSENIIYENLQKEAINGCLGNNIFILTGGPGTGKTTTLNAVIKLFRKKNMSIVLAAPTGRAAKRMSDLTRKTAKTIHRLLEVDITSDRMLTFKRNEITPLRSDVIIIDEMSMVDALLFESLLRAIKPDSKLIMVGDANQLPSVGAGNVLRDLMSANVIPFVELKEIFRQAAKSLIITNAHKIMRGEFPDLEARNKDFFFIERKSDEETAKLVVELAKIRLPQTYNYSPIEDIQVLSPTKMGAAGTKELNRVLQQSLNPHAKNRREIKYFNTIYREGDKIMQISNDYDVGWKKDGEKGKGIFNGDIGIITEINIKNSDTELYINFEGRVARYTLNMLNKIEHAYAITIHKSQGSEYNAVIMPLTARSQQLLYRNLLYTGVTRAKNILIIIGTKRIIAQMTESNKTMNRFSNIKPLLISKTSRK